MSKTQQAGQLPPTTTNTNTNTSMTPTPTQAALANDAQQAFKPPASGPAAAVQPAVSTPLLTQNNAELMNQWMNAWKGPMQQFAAFPAAAAAMTTNPTALAQNLWAATAQSAATQNPNLLALQLATGAAANGDLLAQPQALQQQQQQQSAAGANGKAKVLDHEKLAAASVQAAMTGVNSVQDFKVAQSMQNLAAGGKRDLEENGVADCQDERELKKQRRKQSNRESARRSRLRKQAECEELSIRVNKLSEENEELHNELQRMKWKCENLTNQNKVLQQELHSYAQGDSGKGGAAKKEDGVCPVDAAIAKVDAEVAKVDAAVAKVDEAVAKTEMQDM